MSATSPLFCVLRYVPNILSDRNVPIAIVSNDSSKPEKIRYAIRLAAHWERSVKSVDPTADLSMLKALLKEIGARLASTTLRRQMIAELETSFSNAIQVSEWGACNIEIKNLTHATRLVLVKRQTVLKLTRGAA